MPEITRSVINDVARYVDTWLDHQIRALRIPGAQAAISFEGEILLSGCYGVANVERAIPMSRDHLFRIASHSKTFTATAIMQLCEAQKLRLDDNVGPYIDWLDDTELPGVTIRDLLGHSGGMIRDGIDGDYWQLRFPFPSVGDLPALLSGHARIYAANEQFKYSNMGFTLLGLVIERASGLPYNDYVSRNIVDRLGLKRTGPDYVEQLADDYASGYTYLSDLFPQKRIEQVATGAMSPATGFYSTAEEICSYASAHCFGDTRLITDASKRLLQHPAWKVEGAGYHYGLAFEVIDLDEFRLIGHGGGWPGHTTKTLFAPKERIVVTVLTNVISGAAVDLANGIWKLINWACKSQTQDAPTQDLGRFCGRFYDLWATTDICAFGNRLVMLDPTESDPVPTMSELSVESDSQCRVTKANGFYSPGEPVTFEFSPSGDVTRIRGGSAMSAYPRERFVEEILSGTHVTIPRLANAKQ
jgi:CubicO group peptidase (beta-lactamase class C family)